MAYQYNFLIDYTIYFRQSFVYILLTTESKQKHTDQGSRYGLFET